MDRNSWCKVVDGEIVDGPRAWQDNTPPDESWVPHVLVDTEHTINDRFVGASFAFDVENNRVVETNNYEPKTQEQINAEVQVIKDRAASAVSVATQVLALEDLENREEWESYKAKWSLLTDITELSWDYDMPSPPFTEVL